MVETDQGQIEQVLANLYLNASQAMPGGGELYLETQNVILDEDYTKPYQVEPGKYVKISVTDTGVGMDGNPAEDIRPILYHKGDGLGERSRVGISLRYHQKSSRYHKRSQQEW